MFICLVYPLLYDGMQLKNQKLEYFQDKWNFLDLGHIYLGFANLLVQRFCNDVVDHWVQLLMLIVTTIILLKSFFFLRVFKECSFLVTMIIEVFIELKSFMIFFMINVLFFS